MGGFKGYGGIFLLTCAVYAFVTVVVLFQSAPLTVSTLPFAEFRSDPRTSIDNLTLVWSLDYCGFCTGFAVEAYDFVLGLDSYLKIGLINGKSTRKVSGYV